MNRDTVKKVSLSCHGEKFVVQLCRIWPLLLLYDRQEQQGTLLPDSTPWTMTPGPYRPGNGTVSDGGRLVGHQG